MMTALAVAAFSLACTQLVRDLGLQGGWLKLVCVVVAAAAYRLNTTNPSLWRALGGVAIGVTVTGGVSFLKGVLPPMRGPPSGGRGAD